jgi:hypothetical protein
LDQAELNHDAGSVHTFVLGFSEEDVSITNERMTRTANNGRTRMNDAEIRAELIRHWSDSTNQEQIHEIYHDDLILEFPQSGERLVGRANVLAMRSAYPAKLTFDIQRIRNRGDLWVTELILTYDGGPPVHAVNIMEFRDGKVAHETLYFGEPWDPPAWRAQWVVAPATAGQR